MSQRIVYERGAPCEVENCGSKEYVETDGQWFCRNGHLQARLLIHGDEDPTISSQGRKVKKRRVQDEKMTATLSGRPAIELYLQCYQLVLWKQAHWLVHEKCFPAELEEVIRDIWTLRLQMIQDLVVEQDGEGTASQMFSSQSEGGQSDTDTAVEAATSIPKLQKRIPRLVESLGICYLCFVLLRIPISTGDLRDWVEGEKLVYIHALQAIPKAMRRNLPQSFRSAFQPSSGAPELCKMYLTTASLNTAFRESFGMIVPPLNYHLVLFRLLTDLSLPLEVYPAVTRLAQLIDCDFSFPSTTERYTHVSTHPELQLIALLVIATKLLYPFDSIKRCPLTSTEPAALIVDWEVWAQTRERLNMTITAQKDVKFKRPIEMAEQDVFLMDNRQIDRYLDWFGETWLDDDVNELDREADFRRAIWQMFPVDTSHHTQDETVGVTEDSSTHTASQRWKAIRKVQRSLIRQNPVSDKRSGSEAAIRPGSQYPQYRNKEELPDHARPFFEAAARQVSLPLEVLLVAVQQMESRVQRWVKREEKRKRAPTGREATYSEDGYGATSFAMSADEMEF